MKRTICIGDPQGCATELEQLLEKCKATLDDRVIIVGDLIDRGPESGRCIDIAMRLERRQGAPSAIMGNHESRHLHYKDLETWGRDPKVVIPTHVETRKQLTEEHYAWMRKLKLFIRLPEHDAAVVHAGAYPGRPLEAQDPHHLLHIQMIDPPNEKSMWPSRAPEDWKFWTHFWDGPERLIFGHSVLDRPLLTDTVCGIDGGACFGMELRAVILPGWEIVSVKGQHDHGKGSRGRGREKIKTIPVHGDVCTFS